MAVRNRGNQELMCELISPTSIKEDAEFLMAPYLNFESFLAPAPMSICVLGQLMLISTETDFDLSKKPPTNGFQLLRHPESFRACLVQVANDGYTAFNNAHINMDKIRLETLEIPKSLKKALTILFKGSEIEVEDLLPIEIEAMKNSIEDCLEYARETRGEFDKIMLLTAELLECCTSAEGDYQERLREVAIKLDLAEEQKQRLEEEDKNNKEYKEELKKKVDEAEKDYKNALKDMPGQWSLLLTQAGESACSSISGFMNCFTMGLGMEFLCGASTAVAVGTMVGQNIPGVSKGVKEVASVFKKDQSAAASPQQRKQGGKWEVIRKRINTCQKARKLYDTVTPLYFTLINKNDEKLNADKIDEGMKDQLQRLEEEYKQVDASVTDLGNNTLMEWKALCKGWAEAFADCREISKSMDPDKQTMNHIAERMIGLYNRTVHLETQVATMMGDFSMDVQAPIMEQVQAQNPKNETSEKSAKDSATESARIKLTRTTENLKDLRDNYDKAQERFNNTSKELRQFLAETAQLDMKKVDFEKIRTILRKGIKAFAELRDQWSKLVQFFQMTSSIVEVCLNKSVKKLTKQIEKTSERYLEGYTVEGLHMDMIYKETFHAAKVAYVVNMVSKSYVEVSKEHIMGRIAGLSKLVSYHPEEDKDKIAAAKRLLDRDVKETQDKIVELVKKNRREFYRRTEEKLKTMYLALPPPTPGSKKTEAVVKEGAARGRMTRMLMI